MRKNAATAMEAKTMTNHRDFRGESAAPPPPSAAPMAKYFQPCNEVQLQNCSKWLVAPLRTPGSLLASLLPQPPDGADVDEDSEVVEASKAYFQQTQSIIAGTHTF